MSFFRRMLILTFALIASSCHSSIHGEVPSSAKPLFVAKLWIQDDPLMPKALFLDGCALWAPIGVACKQVINPADAHVRFISVKTPCVATVGPKAKKGDVPKFTLATAHSDGHVEIMVNCMTADEGKIDEDKMRLVIGHEMGHELGIWKHVPLECDDRDQNYVVLSDGSKLCGEALMNSDYDEDVDEITDADGKAFSVRDRNFSIFRPVEAVDGDHGEAPEPVICVYGEPAED